MRARQPRTAYVNHTGRPGLAVFSYLAPSRAGIFCVMAYLLIGKSPLLSHFA